MLMVGSNSGDLILRNIDPLEVNGNYVSWLNDNSTNQFLEVRHSQVSISSQREFVEEINQSDDTCLFGIFAPGEVLIGTTKIGPINKIHETAAMGILIGSSKHRGLGYGSLTISIICKLFAENKILRKINAGVISENFASIRAFEKNSFLREGYRVSQFRGLEGKFMDEVLFGKVLRSEKGPKSF
jgi:ribosomal-protein-alanine N-acetyltransferase